MPGYERRTAFRYRCAVPGMLSFMGGVRLQSFSIKVVDVSNAGLQLHCEGALPTGQVGMLTLDEYAAEPLYVQVVRCLQERIRGYLYGCVVVQGALPYGIFSQVTQESPTSNDSSTPTCLRELGLGMPCTIEEIRNAYHEKARACHPDRGGDVRQFVALKHAYEEALSVLTAN